MMHHHSKFGNKMFGSSEDIVQINIHQHFDLHCDLDLEHSNQNFPQDTPAHDDLPSS